MPLLHQNIGKTGMCVRLFKLPYNQRDKTLAGSTPKHQQMTTVPIDCTNSPNPTNMATNVEILIYGPVSVPFLTLLLLIVAKIRILKKVHIFPWKSQDLNSAMQMFFPKRFHLNGNNNTIGFLPQMQKLGICKIIFDTFVFPLFRNKKGKVTAVKNQGEVDL